MTINPLDNIHKKPISTLNYILESEFGIKLIEPKIIATKNNHGMRLKHKPGKKPYKKTYDVRILGNIYNKP